MARPPDIVVVVLDCLRAASLPSDDAELAALPSFRALRRESLVFPRCAAPSHWTVPSHASLLTGLYPWDHGYFHGGSGSDAGTVPTMAERLRGAGYRTAGFCANGLLNPAAGWLRGVDYLAWGSSAYWRSSRKDAPPNEHRAPGPPWSGSESRWPAGAYWAVVGLERFPWVLDRLARVEHRWRGGAPGTRPAMAAWIEPALRKWWSDGSDDAPRFALLNLMDAHEPYLIDREDGVGADVRHAAGRVRQDHHGWIAGQYDPSPEDAALLEGLYRAAIRALDRRLGTVVDILRRHGRWEETLLVVTSDHGQTFGASGGLYHMTGLSEDLLRVPLWVRWPGEVDAGSTARGWASLVDVGPTLLRAAGASPVAAPDAVDLGRLVRAERPSPVFALGDGPTFGESGGRLGLGNVSRFDPPALVAYEGARKAVRVLGSAATQLYAVDDRASPARAVPGPDPVEAAMVPILARLAVPEGTGAAGVTSRLRAWGYLD